MESKGYKPIKVGTGTLSKYVFIDILVFAFDFRQISELMTLLSSNTRSIFRDLAPFIKTVAGSQQYCIYQIQDKHFNNSEYLQRVISSQKIQIGFLFSSAMKKIIVQGPKSLDNLMKDLVSGNSLTNHKPLRNTNIIVVLKELSLTQEDYVFLQEIKGNLQSRYQLNLELALRKCGRAKKFLEFCLDEDVKQAIKANFQKDINLESLEKLQISLESRNELKLKQQVLQLVKDLTIVTGKKQLNYQPGMLQQMTNLKLIALKLKGHISFQDIGLLFKEIANVKLQHLKLTVNLSIHTDERTLELKSGVLLMLTTNLKSLKLNCPESHEAITPFVFENLGFSNLTCLSISIINKYELSALISFLLVRPKASQLYYLSLFLAPFTYNVKSASKLEAQTYIRHLRIRGFRQKKPVLIQGLSRLFFGTFKNNPLDSLSLDRVTIRNKSVFKRIGKSKLLKSLTISQAAVSQLKLVTLGRAFKSNIRLQRSLQFLNLSAATKKDFYDLADTISLLRNLKQLKLDIFYEAKLEVKMLKLIKVVSQLPYLEYVSLSDIQINASLKSFSKDTYSQLKPMFDMIITATEENKEGLIVQKVLQLDISEKFNLDKYHQALIEERLHVLDSLLEKKQVYLTLAFPKLGLMREINIEQFQNLSILLASIEPKWIFT